MRSSWISATTEVSVIRRKRGGVTIDMAGQRSPLVLISKSPEETFRIGRLLGESLQSGDCVALKGELGSGKTCLTQGIARGLHVPDSYAVTSPTFTLINEYPGCETTLVHMDVYRLTGSADLDDMGYEEYLRGNCVVVIEWAEKIRDAVPDAAICVECTYLDENMRKYEISGCRNRIGAWERTFNQGGC
jgi:tRNA threonylcarbamoyladenosine biosynthesis protein TsaE